MISTLIFVTLMLCGYAIYSNKKQRKIKKWYKKLNLDTHIPQLNYLFCDVNGFILSKKARNKKDALEYVYGEIDYVSFAALLSLVNPNQKTIFYDLGSGIGKAVFACLMIFDVEKSYGVEIFSELHECAQHQKERLRQLSAYEDQAQRISFINADLLSQCYPDATLIFINATAYFGEHWQNITKHLEHVANNTIVITTSKVLKSQAFALLKTTPVKMSWGQVNAFIQIKRDISV